MGCGQATAKNPHSIVPIEEAPPPVELSPKKKTAPKADENRLAQIAERFSFDQAAPSIDLSFKHLGDTKIDDIAYFIAYSKTLKKVTLSNVCD